MSDMTSQGRPAVQSGVRQLAPADFAAQSPSRVTINVHVPDEGSLPDTDVAIPYDQITDRQGELPTDKNAGLAIYCLTGSMSAIAGQTLTGQGNFQ